MALTDVEMVEVGKRADRFWPRLVESFSVHGIFLGVVLLFLAASKIAGVFNPLVAKHDSFATFIGVFSFSIPVAILGMVLIQFYFVASVDKSDKPLKDLWRRMKAVFSHHDTMVRGLPLYLCLLVFMYTFTVLKSNIPDFNAFAWDPTFDELDRVVHFGTRPWEWLQPIFGNLPATLLLNLNYNLWFMIMQVFWVYFAFVKSPGVQRTQFYLSFFLVWSIGGIFIASLLSSAGPCYYNLVVDGANPYAPLMEQLRAFNAIVPVWAVDTQTMLWQLRQDGSAMGGVTAMPSMHNATTLLFVLTAWNGPKILRNLLIAHMALIFLGSIHLGWHYAVDAYVGWTITLTLWVVAGKLAKAWNSRSQVQVFNASCVANI
jgi:hypothetical protein